MENQENPNPIEPSSSKKAFNSRKPLYFVIIILIVGGAIYAYSSSQNTAPEDRQTLRDITQLNEEDRIKALEERVNELAKDAKDIADNAESSIKYTAYIQLAEAQLELGKFTEAMDSLNKIPEDKRSNSRVDVALARAYKGTGDLAKAKEISANNIKAYELEPSAWLAHIDINSDLPFDQLSASYRQAITATKSNVDIMISYAKFSEKAGDKATAIAAWETAANVDPSNEGKYREEIARLR